MGARFHPSLHQRPGIATEMAAAERAYERLATGRLPGNEGSPLQKPSAVFGMSNADVLEFNEAMKDLEEHVNGLAAAFPIGQCRRTLADVLRRLAWSIPQAGNPELLRVPKPPAPSPQR
jgi:hypothetical protein